MELPYGTIRVHSIDFITVECLRGQYGVNAVFVEGTDVFELTSGEVHYQIQLSVSLYILDRSP